MKKYLNKAYLTKVPVMIFLFTMTVNVMALVYDIITSKWSDVIATVAIIVMLINWFVMWNLYERAMELSEELLDDNWEITRENYQNKHTLRQIAIQLGIISRSHTVDVAKIKARIDELLKK